MTIDWTEVRRGIRMCLKKLNLHDMHDDVEQEAMLRAFQYQNKYRGDASFSTWGYSIARNEALKFFQERKREFALFVKHEDGVHDGYSEEASDTEEGLTQDVVFDKYAERLHHAVLANVSPEWLPRLVDRYLHGMRYREIADKYGIPIGTVQSSLSRIRTAIKADLEAITIIFDEDCTKRVIRNAIQLTSDHVQNNQPRGS